MTIRRYLYDGWNLVAEFEEVSSAIGDLKRSYTWGLDIAGTLRGTGGVGALIEFSVHDSSTVTDYYPTYDGNGNMSALVKSNGTLAAAYEYGPFGENIRAQELDSLVAGNPFRFSTKFTDVETGLVYYGHRYYSPSLGRFINKDPIEEQGGLNLYAFVGNDPINAVDVLGLECTWEEKGGKMVLNCDKWYLIDASDFGDGSFGNFDPITGIIGGGSSSVGGGDRDKPAAHPLYVVNDTRINNKNPTTKSLIDKLRLLPCDQRQLLLDRAGAAFDFWGDMQSELTQVIFGGKNGAPTSVGEVLTGEMKMHFDAPIFRSKEVIRSYFNSPIVQQTVQESGLAAIFMSHSDSINTGDLPENVSIYTHTSPVPTVFYNPQNVTVISPSIQPVIDRSGKRSTFQGAEPVLSSSPGVEVTPNKAFVAAVMEGCQ